MPLVILGTRVALLRRQIPGTINDLQARLSEPLLKPLRRDEEEVLIGHLRSSRRETFGALRRAAPQKIQTILCRRRPEADAEAAVLATLLLDLADMDIADLARSGDV